MKRFLLSIVALAFVLLVMIYAQIIIYRYVILNFGMLQVDKDVNTIVIGASSLETALDDSLIENTVNLCQGGDFILFDYVKIKKLHQLNSGIETIILGFDPENLFGKEFYNKKSIRLQYIRYFFLIDFEDYGDLIKYIPETLSSGVVGTGRFLFKIKQIISAESITEIGIGKFLPRPDTSSELFTDIIENQIDPDAEIDPITLKYLNRIVKYCKTNGLKLIILNGPVHGSLIKKRIVQRKKYLDIMNDYNSEDFIFWDVEEYIKDDSLFFDDNHLNHRGAKIYSKMINRKLNTISFNK